MTALTGNKQRNSRSIRGEIALQKLKALGATGAGAAYTVYKGAIVMCDVSEGDGYFRNCAGTPAAGDIFGGIAVSKTVIEATDTANGCKNIDVAIKGAFPFAKGSLTIANIGAPVYATDDNTIQASSTDALWIGYVVDVDDTYAWVDIEKAWMMANSAT